MPTTTRAKAKAKAAKDNAEAKAKAVPSGKENSAASAKTVNQKLAQAKLNRELAKSRYPLTTQPLPEEDTFRRLPLEAALAPTTLVDFCLKRDLVYKNLAKESDELNELAGLGIAGTTPGGRRWRARLSAGKSSAISPMASMEEAELEAEPEAELAPRAEAGATAVEELVSSAA